jgi:hypothetical protein
MLTFLRKGYTHTHLRQHRNLSYQYHNELGGVRSNYCLATFWNICALHTAFPRLTLGFKGPKAARYIPTLQGISILEEAPQTASHLGLNWPLWTWSWFMTGYRSSIADILCRCGLDDLEALTNLLRAMTLSLEAIMIRRAVVFR